MEPFCGPECRSQTLSIQATLCTAIATLIVVVLTFPFSISFNVLFKQNNLEKRNQYSFYASCLPQGLSRDKNKQHLKECFSRRDIKIDF